MVISDGGKPAEGYDMETSGNVPGNYAGQDELEDQESISLAIEKIGRPFLEGGCEPVRQAIQAYNHGPDYEDEVMAIFSELSCMVDYDTQITMDNKSCKR